MFLAKSTDANGLFITFARASGRVLTRNGRFLSKIEEYTEKENAQTASMVDLKETATMSHFLLTMTRRVIMAVTITYLRAVKRRRRMKRVSITILG